MFTLGMEDLQLLNFHLIKHHHNHLRNLSDMIAKVEYPVLSAWIEDVLSKVHLHMIIYTYAYTYICIHIGLHVCIYTYMYNS
jgi:hypothetical protein